jgi:hypothetical protein
LGLEPSERYDTVEKGELVVLGEKEGEVKIGMGSVEASFTS